ncbi:hypothetical protein ACIBG0_39625 [Nocardia sp. NPDC050630]|uniref:hypothetical protein n=1 Tax=Nocardia sp. NPDC050630 TaxID=3364321 RepID=UPI00379FED4E
MTRTTTTAAPGTQPQSPFTGADICRTAGLTLPDGTPRPAFDDDLWDFTDVVGLPVQMALYRRRFDFTTITEPGWRLVTKELILALLAPNHDAVVRLPRAYRTALQLTSCYNRLYEAGRFFGWLGQRGITTLAELDTRLCEEYLAFRRYVIDTDGVVVGEQSAGVRRTAAQIIVDLVDYRDLFTTDQVPADLRPWGGATASAVAEMPSGRDGNKTPAVPAGVLQPMLAAALHLVQILGPHVVELHEQIRHTDHVWATGAAGLRHGSSAMVGDIDRLLGEHRVTGTPLPMLEEHDINRRLAAGGRERSAAAGLHRHPGPAGRIRPVLVEMDARTAQTADRYSQHRRSREDLRPQRRRSHDSRWRNFTALDFATAPIRSRRSDRHCPHRGDRGPGCRVRDAGR